MLCFVGLTWSNYHRILDLNLQIKNYHRRPLNSSAIYLGISVSIYSYKNLYFPEKLLKFSKCDFYFYSRGQNCLVAVARDRFHA